MRIEITLSSRIIETAAFNLIKSAVIHLPQDIKNGLIKAYDRETNKTARIQLKTILDNIKLAEKQQAPLCQDTGTITFYVKAGSNFQDLGVIESALINATRKATNEVPLRPNAVNPFTQKNSNDNTGRFVPIIFWEIVEGNGLELTVMMKGGGSENVSALGMLNPSDGINGVKKFVVDAVIKAGAQPCPPTILGVAIGGTADMATYLAKKALFKPLNEENPESNLARLEHELLQAVNLTGIGPMGLGGKTTVLGIHLDYAFRHPASFPVAVAFSCWADRHASAKISSNCQVEYSINGAINNL